ncbi:RES family NAD+ phosphorylase [Limimaricola cinnabarinus]|uniref:RES family NAD+ phosphorylase n=1 Tax=Limimaricola cinnabarinus TaxID=1125964 RepID=UPI002283D7CF|nr:RES family NAD+ phosphorylase [Limimaricola cinnabarinus]
MTTGADIFRPLSIPLWRICAEGAEPLAPVASASGRFHHDGQPALYASLSPEGAGVAMASYASPGDPPRLIWPLHLAPKALADLRDRAVCAALGIDPDDLVSRWADDRAAGRQVRSWRASDHLRAMGPDGFLYPSRKAPEHGHVILFATKGLRLAGPPEPWSLAAPIR